MNKDQVSGAISKVLGRLQEHLGKTVGSAIQQARGLALQRKGRLKAACGAMKEVLSKSRHS